MSKSSLDGMGVCAPLFSCCIAARCSLFMTWTITLSESGTKPKKNCNYFSAEIIGIVNWYCLLNQKNKLWFFFFLVWARWCDFELFYILHVSPLSVFDATNSNATSNSTILRVILNLKRTFIVCILVINSRQNE